MKWQRWIISTAYMTVSAWFLTGTEPNLAKGLFWGMGAVWCAIIAASQEIVAALSSASPEKNTPPT